MSCPRWPDLLAERERLAGGDPEGWGDALAHLDGCGACRRQALAIDPTLLFRRLPVPPGGASEVEPMRQRVTAARRARRVEGALAAAHRRSWRRAAAAVLFASLGLLAPPRVTVPETARGGAVVAASGAIPPAARAALSARLAELPVIEDLEGPYEQVLQWTEEDLAVVLVVDGRLDV